MYPQRLNVEPALVNSRVWCRLFRSDDREACALLAQRSGSLLWQVREHVRCLQPLSQARTPELPQIAAAGLWRSMRSSRSNWSILPRSSCVKPSPTPLQQSAKLLPVIHRNHAPRDAPTCRLNPPCCCWARPRSEATSQYSDTRERPLIGDELLVAGGGHRAEKKWSTESTDPMSTARANGARTDRRMERAPVAQSVSRGRTMPAGRPHAVHTRRAVDRSPAASGRRRRRWRLHGTAPGTALAPDPAPLVVAETKRVDKHSPARRSAGVGLQQRHQRLPAPTPGEARWTSTMAFTAGHSVLNALGKRVSKSSTLAHVGVTAMRHICTSAGN